MNEMSRDEIIEVIRSGRKSVVLLIDGKYQDLKAHTVMRFDEFPRKVQETPHELIVFHRKRIYAKEAPNLD